MDYARALATAERMIREKGRAIGLVPRASGRADPEPGQDHLSAPAPAGDAVRGLSGVFVSPGSASSLGLSQTAAALFKNSTSICLMAANSPVDPIDCLWLIDSDDSQWKIEHVETLKPGDTAILHYIGVRRST